MNEEIRDYNVGRNQLEMLEAAEAARRAFAYWVLLGPSESYYLHYLHLRTN